jgi:hypothetical protein
VLSFWVAWDKQMSFKDENEILSGVPMGHTAFTSVPPRGEYKGDTAPKKRGPKQMSKLELSCSVLDTPEEKAQKRKEREERLRAARTEFSSAKEVAIAARGALQSKRVSEQRAKGFEMGTMYGLSRSADEKILAHKARDKKDYRTQEREQLQRADCFA